MFFLLIIFIRLPGFGLKFLVESSSTVTASIARVLHRKYFGKKVTLRAALQVDKELSLKLHL